MKEAIKNIAYASVLGTASMIGATQSNADVISITNTSSNQDIGGQGAAVNFIDDPAVTNGYDEGLDVLDKPHEPAHPLDRFFSTYQEVEARRLGVDYRPFPEAGDTFLFELTAYEGKGEDFTANNHLDVSGTTFGDNPNGIVDYSLIGAIDTDSDGNKDMIIEYPSVKDLIQNHDGKTESWTQAIPANLDPTGNNSYGTIAMTAQIPEPSSMALVASMGLAALTGMAFKRSGKKKKNLEDRANE